MVDKKFPGVLAFDCEAANPYYGCPTKEQKLRLFICYSYDDQKVHYLYDKGEILKMINRHKYMITFNGMGGKLKGDFFDGYDNQLLHYNGFSDLIKQGTDKTFRIKGKTNIDLMMIFRSRCGSMKIKDGMLGDLLMRFSLDYISQIIGIVSKEEGKIKDFDYDLLLPEASEWTIDNKRTIEEYALRDIEITCKMYEWIEEYFDSFKDYLNEQDIIDKKYLTCSIASFAYKAVCNSLGWKEEYSDDKSGNKYKGAVVAFPPGEAFHGTIWALDFASLYPHMNMMANLFSPVGEGKGWHGNDMFKPVGTYNTTQRGKVETFLSDLYKRRQELKKIKSPKEYSAKIILNSLYGASGNPVFKNLYNPVTAADCTYLGRECIKFAKKTFTDNGYKLLALDTDSNYILDPFNDKEKIIILKNHIVKTIKDNMPFPMETFDMEIEAEITDMFFVKGAPKTSKVAPEYIDEQDERNSKLGYLKKNYIYRKSNGQIIYKNMGIKKKSSPEVCRYIFKNILIPKISEERKAKFSEAYLKNLIFELLQKDLSMATVRFSAKPPGMYKTEGDMHAQIAKIYGPGIHFMIPIKKDVYDKDRKLLSAGKEKKYISLENFKKENLRIQDIDLDLIFSGLEYFIQNSQSLLSDFFGDKKTV